MLFRLDPGYSSTSTATGEETFTAGFTSMPSTSIQPILDAAFAEYAEHLGIDPAKHPFADQLQACDSPDDVLKLLEVKANEFKDYRDGNRKLIDCLKPVVNVIHVFSDVLGEFVNLVSRNRPRTLCLFTLSLFCY